MKKKLFLFYICISLLLTACSNVKNVAGIIGSKEAEVEKYNSYIELSDFVDDWILPIAAHYFNSLGEGEEITIKENFQGFTLGDVQGKTMYEFHKDQHTKLARQYQSAKPSYGEADVKMKLLCDKTEEFIEVYFKEVNSYYTNKEYEKDGFAKGRELHKKMILAYNELVDANDEFFDEFYPYVLESEAAELPKLKESGFNIRYYAFSTVLTGKEIEHMFDKLEHEGKDFLTADLEQYEKLHNKFNSDIEELKKIYKDSSQQKKEGYSASGAKFLNQFVDTAEKMQTAATDTSNMLKAGTTNIKNESSGKVTTGGQNNPTKRFKNRLHQLINEYNRSIE